MSRNSWKQYYLSLASNEQGNQKINAFTEASLLQNSKKNRLSNITEELDYVVLTGDGFNKVQILHSIKNVGGTRLRPANKILALIGQGPNSVPVIVDEESLLADVDICSPKFEDLVACKLVEAIRALTTPGNRAAVRLHGSGFFLLAPTIRDAVLTGIQVRSYIPDHFFTSFI